MLAVVQMISVVNLSYKQLSYQINKQNYVSKNSHSKVIRERQCIFPDQKIKIFSLIKRMVSGRTYHLMPIAQMRPRLHNGKPLVMNHSQAVLTGGFLAQPQPPATRTTAHASSSAIFLATNHSSAMDSVRVEPPPIRSTSSAAGGMRSSPTSPTPIPFPWSRTANRP